MLSYANSRCSVYVGCVRGLSPSRDRRHLGVGRGGGGHAADHDTERAGGADAVGWVPGLDGGAHAAAHERHCMEQQQQQQQQQQQ